jgi:hypothetical protein
MFGGVLGVALGVVAIVIGVQGFTARGLPLTAKKRLIGPPAKVVGVCCIALGCLMILAGLAGILIIALR